MFGDLHAPCSQSRPLLAANEKRMRGFVKRRSRQLIAAPADPPLNIRLAGLVAAWGEPQMCAHVPRFLESFRLINRRPESKSRQRTDARRAHQPSTDRFRPNDDERLLRQSGELVQHSAEDLKERLHHYRLYPSSRGHFSAVGAAD